MVTRTRTSFWRRRWFRWLAGCLVLSVALLAILVDVLAHRAEPFVHDRVVKALAERFHARVELDSFHLSLGNTLQGEWGIWGDGRGLRIWPPPAADGAPPSSNPDEPMIRLDEFRFHAPLHYKSGDPVHIALVRLKGLTIHVPPRSHFQRPEGNSQPAKSSNSGAPGIRFQIDTLNCVGADVELETDKPDKLPLDFQISQFTLKGIRPDAAMNFDAALTNPRPPGVIHATGKFGPWNMTDPGESPVQGKYSFDHADLSVFKGIAGILSSTGSYQGTLRNIVVDGQTDTPDFKLTKFGNTVVLHTNFHARVDGTNGDTWLDPVDATMGHSHFTARGQVVRALSSDGGRLHSVGHDIALTVNVGKARIEDFLRLASNTSTPLLTGDVVVKADLHIPPAPQETVSQRMRLKGQFTLDSAEFTSPTVQERIRSLSLRGQGKPGELKTDNGPHVQSKMQGDFDLGAGLLSLPSLMYSVPGADIRLKGTYDQKSDHLDFIGTARLQATVSQIVGGWKGALLKPADKFFEKDGAGTQIPIFISGSREKPEFGFDFKHNVTTHPERPGDK